MRPRLILPNTLVEVSSRDPVFFLGGPILGGGDWQREAIEFLAREWPEAFIVCPCRYGPEHSLYPFRLAGIEEEFPHQTAWERHYMEVAASQGVLIFWLPQESWENPRPPEMGPYARDTYGELGEWRARAMLTFEPVSLVIGAEAEFPGLSIIEKNFHAALGEEFVFHSTLQATLEAALLRS